MHSDLAYAADKSFDDRGLIVRRPVRSPRTWPASIVVRSDGCRWRVLSSLSLHSRCAPQGTHKDLRRGARFCASIGTLAGVTRVIFDCAPINHSSDLATAIRECSHRPQRPWARGVDGESVLLVLPPFLLPVRELPEDVVVKLTRKPRKRIGALAIRTMT